MTSCLRRTTLFAAALILAPVALSAGWYYEAVTTTESDQPGGSGTMTVRAWVDGDATKIEFVDGDESGFMAAGNYIVTNDAGETTYLVNPSEQTYAPFNLGELMNTAGAMMEGMGDMFKIEFTDIATEKISEGPGGSILGYSTKHLQYRTNYTMNMAIMGMKSQQQVDIAQDMWVADAFDPRAFAVWLRPDKRMAGMFEGMDELLEAEFSKIDGIPLKAVMVQNTTSTGGGFPGAGGGGGNSTMTMTTEVSALREESVSADIFTIPAGYTETELIPEMGDLEQMMQGQQQGQAEQPQEEQKRKRPRLKDLLKGGGGGS